MEKTAYVFLKKQPDGLHAKYVSIHTEVRKRYISCPKQTITQTKA